MKRNLWAIAAMAAVTFGLYGCGDSNSTSSEPVNNESENNEPVNVPLLPISNLSKDLCGDLWCESDDDGKIEIGSDEETAGYWFIVSDSTEPYKGNSDIKLSYDVEADKDDGGEYSHFFCGGNFFCGSDFDIKIQGTATLGDAYSNPFVGIGFNLVSEKREPMDISSWEGVCLIYSSTGKLALELVQPGTPMGHESNNFGYELPKTSAVSMINLPWSAFGLYDVSKSPSTDPLWTVQNAAAIELRFYENSDFYVYSIGRYGTCGKQLIKKRAPLMRVGFFSK